MPRKSALLPALLLLAVACGGGSGPVHFGMAGPFTEGFGEMNKRGAELAAAEINAAGGIDGDSLIIDYKDDKGDGATAVGIAQGFVEDARVIGVVGHVNSGAMVAAAKIYDGSLPAVATTASSAQLTGISPWAFRVISSDSSNGVDLAHFAQRLGKKRAAILYENDSYGRGLADAFRGAFTGQVIGLDPIPADGANATLYVEWLLAHDPDIVFVAGTERSGMSLLRAARARGLAADFLGGDGWTGVVNAGEAAEGALVGAPFTALDPRPEAQKFVSAFRQRFSIEPDGNSALAYDAVMLLTAGIRAVGRDRAALRDWLANLQTEGSFAGVTGPIAFHETGDPIGKSFTMTRVVRGNLVLAERGAP